MEMTPQRWAATNQYALEVFGSEDDVLRRLRGDAVTAGLPDIAVTPDVGRLLQILASTTRGRMALELGTLGGYSTMWLVRGLRPGGRLITVEFNDRHADFAEQHFAAAGLAGQIDVRRGPALDVLPGIAAEVGVGSVDVVFIDADKAEYPDYYLGVKELLAPGAMLLVDNIFGTGRSWVDDLSDPGMAGVDRMNRMVAADPDFVTAGVSIRQGILVARRRG